MGKRISKQIGEISSSRLKKHQSDASESKTKLKSKRVRPPAPPLSLAINASLIEEGMTQSEMQLMDNCPEAWYLRYNLMLTRKGEFSWATTYGGWMHSFLEEYYATKGKRWSVNPELRERKFITGAVLQEYEYWAGLLQIQAEIYASHFKQDFKLYKIKENETLVDFTWKGVRLKGKIDLYVFAKHLKGYYVWDHKTASRIDKQTVMGWDFRFQFMFYCWLAWKIWPKRKVKGFIVNAIRKPQIRKGERESTGSFLQRVRSDMLARPEFYFYREPLKLRAGDLQHFEDQILTPKINRIKMMLDPKIKDSVKIAMLRNKNTDHCLAYNRPCQFMQICKNGFDIEQHFYIKREHKHEELVLEFE
jgi:hypothetical protein